MPLPEVETIQKRMWIKSGVVEDLDEKQIRLVSLVHEKIMFYYRELYQTQACYQYPLSLSRLMKLCRRSGQTVSTALRYLANTVPVGSHDRPTVYYDRLQSKKNKTHRPYRIFLRQRGGE